MLRKKRLLEFVNKFDDDTIFLSGYGESTGEETKTIIIALKPNGKGYLYLGDIDNDGNQEVI